MKADLTQEINEAAPTVPGSRGGYGLYQLTGPRRVAYEQYAAQKGVDPSNVDAQLDFMMSELQGPESRAAQSILAAPDAGSAAAAIARDFLRPAPEHLNSRVAKYTAGGAPVQVASLDPSIGAPAPQAQQLPAIAPPAAEVPAQQQIAQALIGGGKQAPAMAQGGGMPSMQQLAEAAANPWLSESQRSIINSLLGQQMEQQQQANDPLRQLQLQSAQQELNAPIEVGGVLLDRNTMQPIFDSRTSKGAGLINAGDGQIYDPATKSWITAPTGAKPPTLVELFDETTGQPYKAKFNAETGGYDRVGGIKAPTGTQLSVDPTTGAVTFQQGSGMKPLTENQSKLTLFQTLQTETQPVLLNLESQFDPANLQDTAARSTPIAGNFFQSEQGQIYTSAANAWAEGALRIATGAAATPDEMQRTIRTYFAQPGDTPNTISFKAQMREMYGRAIDNSLGKPTEGSLPTPAQFAQQAAPAIAGEQPAQPQQSQPIKVTNEQDYNALPSGSVYLDPTGQIRTKR